MDGMAFGLVGLMVGVIIGFFVLPVIFRRDLDA